MFFDQITPDDGLYIKVESELWRGKTPYQKVQILNLKGFGKSLILDGKIQSTVQDEYIYHETLVHPAMLSHPDPKTVLVIGGGEGATIREVLRHKSVKRCVMVDLDEEVVRICQKFFPEMHQNSFDDPRVELYFEDGRKFIENSKDSSFDVIIMDSTDPLEGGPSYLLFTLEFYKEVIRKLTKNGVFVVQSNMVRQKNCFCFGSILKTLSLVFPKSYAYHTYIPSFFTEWGFCVGSKGPDIRKIPSSKIDELIKKRIKGKLRYLDGAFIHRMCVFSKDILDEIKKESRIIRDSQPLFAV